MKPTTNKSLSCSAFGHNYVKSKTNTDLTSEFTCSNCNTVVVTDSEGNFEEPRTFNKDVLTTLMQLMHLNKRISKSSF